MQWGQTKPKMKRTLVLTDRQQLLHRALLTSLSGPAIRRMLHMKPSQFHNTAKDVYTKLGYRSRVHMMGCEIGRLNALVNRGAGRP